MPRRLPSSALDSQTILTASSTGAVLAANWYIGTSGLGAGATGPGQVVGTLNGPLNGNAASATKWANKVVVNGTDLIGDVTPLTIGVNTTLNTTAGTYYPLFVPSNTAGNQQASTSDTSGFTFNPSTKNLVVAGTVTGSNLSGTHSGTSSGTNTGDQTLPTTLPHNGTALSATTGLFTGHIDCVSDAGTSGYGLRIKATAGLDGTYAGIQFLNPAGNEQFGQIFGDVGGVGVTGSFRTGGDITVASGSFFKGNGSQLTNLPIPVTSVNGQTGAVTVTSGVTSVNGSTGAVIVNSLYDTIASRYVDTQKLYKSVFIIGGGYLGDYFGSTGLQGITGLTINNFSSVGNTDAESGGFVNYVVSFSITWSQAWFDEYAPGYSPTHLRKAVIRASESSFTYSWNGQPSTTVWTVSSGDPSYTTTQNVTGFSNSSSTTSFAFTTPNFVFVNGRYSPPSWSAQLMLITYFAR